MSNKIPSAGTKAEQSKEDETQVTSSPNNGNTFVMCSQSRITELSCEGKPLNPHLSLDEIRKLSWRELPWYHTTEGTNWHHAEQMKKYDLSSPAFQRKMLFTNYITIATGAILFLLLLLEVLIAKK